MPKVKFETEKGDMDAVERVFFSESKTEDPVQRIVELEGAVAAQRAAFEAVIAELEETRLNMEKALAYSNKMAETADNAIRVKNHFLRNISHELRTPIVSILGMTRLLSEGTLSNEQFEFSQVITANAKELMCIIDDMLDLSKIESDSLIIANEPFDLEAVLGDALECASFVAREKSLYLDVVCDKAVPTRLKGDAGRIRQTLVNLIGNALKFTDKGRVDVRVTLDSQTEDTANIRFSVRDTGLGISEGAENMIFESVLDESGLAARRREGIGLGLAVSKKLVEAMHGEIGGQNREEGGAEFFFWVPLKKQPDAYAAWDSFDKLFGRKAIVFGPEPRSNEALALMLKGAAVKTVCADDPNELVKAVKNAIKSDTRFDFALFSTEASAEITSIFRDDLFAFQAFESTHFIGIHPPGHRASAIPPQRKIFFACLERPVRQFFLYQLLKTAADDLVSMDRPTRPLRQLPTSRPLRILLVEDHLYSQKLASQILTRHGYHVTVAVNGLKALELLRAELYDLVLMDIEMPVMDGLSAARAIRNSSGGAKDPEVPIIALTAHAYDEDKQVCLKAGMNDFLLKPLDPLALKRAVDRFWGEDYRAPSS